MSPTVSLEIQNEQLLLHPGRAVIWPRRRTVIVADTHFGKSGHFGRHGMAVPGGSDAADRQRLSHLVRDTDARRLVILGDFLHAALDAVDAEDLTAWASSLGRTVDIHVIAGNHDRGAAAAWPQGLHWWEDTWVDPPFLFVHDADRVRSIDGLPPFTLSGHVHPVVRLSGVIKRPMRVPVFWRRAAGLVLPSFGLFTGGFPVKPRHGESVFAVGPTRVVSLPCR